MLKTIGLATVAAMAIGTGTSQAALVTLSSAGQSATFAYFGAPTCAQCIAEVKVTLVSTTQLKFDFANDSTDGTNPVKQNILTAFGFNFTPDINFSGATANFNGLDWKIGQAGMGNLEFQAGGVNGINDGLDSGDTGSITVTLGGANTVNIPLDVDKTQVHFQAIAEGGGSIKPAGGVCTTNCPTATVFSTPDGGMTLSLLGLALAGVGMMRRRLR